MVDMHPNGLEMTQQLLELGVSNIPTGGAILDIGCGDGTTVLQLRNKGYQAIGIDKQIEHQNQKYVFEGNMNQLSFDNNMFDGIIAECSISLSEDLFITLSECYRVLKKNGIMLCSDVYFNPDSSVLAPTLSLPFAATQKNWETAISQAGFKIDTFIDKTKEWRSYYLKQLWEGIDIAEMYNSKEGYLKGSRPGYFLLMAKK